MSRADFSSRASPAQERHAQLIFGTIGLGSQALTAFDHLLQLTAESNPGIDLEVDTAPGLTIGRHVRSWGRWDDPGADLTLLLDGEIRLVDGTETTNRGTSEPELGAIAALYRQVGPEVWDRLDGSFCLIIRDGRSVRIGFDVAGTRAVYWWAADGMIAFHSRLLDLVPAYPSDLRVDEVGVATFLADSFYPRDLTAFEGIRLVGAGQVLEIDPGWNEWTAAPRNYFSFVPTSEHSGRAMDVLADELNELLEAAVARCWRAAARPVVPLSGGVDSRYLAAMAVRVAGDPTQVQTITWGEEPTRPGSDAVIAPRVATALGVTHLWCEKRQLHRRATVERALYLTSGEGDGALTYPSEHEIHERFRERHGWQSLFRGDEAFGEAHRLLTRRAEFPAASLTRLGLDGAFARFLGADLLESMADRQDDLYARWKADLTADSPHGRLYELKYQAVFRRVYNPYNTLKNIHFEVYTPFLERPVLDWIRGLPDEYRSDKRLFRIALDRRFPALSTIPFASRSNVTDWEGLGRTDPALARSYRDLCEQPGWLDTIGTKREVMEALEALEADARASASERTSPARPSDLSARQRLRASARDRALATLPGRLVREWTAERRTVRHRSGYQRLSRLVMIHVLVGLARTRHARWRPAGRAE